jgi:hypothetical protein
MASDISIPGPTLTPELIARLLEGAESGLFKESVAAACGVTAEDLDTWIAMGLAPGATEPYRTFAKMYVAREEGAQLPYINAWRQAAAVTWQAAQAWLVARNPDQWGPKATKNRRAIDLQPSIADTQAEEEMVRQLVRTRPPALLKILAEEGLLKDEEGAKKGK